MNRLLPIAAAVAVLSAAASAQAATPISQVNVVVGPDLQRKAAETYGVREVDRLADDLRAQVERTLARQGGLSPDGARLNLVLVDAVPNRPTFKQLGDKPGLSLQSFGVGGARIEGQAVMADGSTTPVAYRWYESDIRNAWPSTTWSDAQRTFDRFALNVARGDLYAKR